MFKVCRFVCYSSMVNPVTVKTQYVLYLDKLWSVKCLRCYSGWSIQQMHINKKRKWAACVSGKRELVDVVDKFMHSRDKMWKNIHDNEVKLCSNLEYKRKTSVRLVTAHLRVILVMLNLETIQGGRAICCIVRSHRILNLSLVIHKKHVLAFYLLLLII